MQVFRILFFVMACTWAGLSYGTDYILYAYHLKPPYIIDRDKETGLYYDMARYLNSKVPGHTFRTVYLPRRRLENDLELGRLNGLVIGVNPAWFKDEQRTRYLWTPAILHDTDIVVSRAVRPVAYEGPESLADHLVGLSFGYYYFGIDEQVRAGRIRRDDAINEEASLDKLWRQRIDAAVVTRRTYEYLLRQRPEWQGQFFVARKPHDDFDRMILIPREFAAVAPELALAVGAMAHDAEWQKQLRRY